MKPAPFDYLRATSAAEVFAALAGTEGARVIAGGQSLLPMLNMRLARPPLLVDIMGISEWREISVERGSFVIGAGVRQMEVERHAGLAESQPLLAAALQWVGHTQTRSRGTFCGSVAHADPSAEIPLVLTALQGEIHLRSRKRTRRVPANAFFTGMMTTSRGEDEMIEAISLPPRAAGSGYAFREVARRHGDFAIVGCAAVVDATSARLAVAGVADRPEARDLPAPGDGDELDEALNDFAWSLDARDDIHATGRYRRELVRKLGREVIEEAARCRS